MGSSTISMAIFISFLYVYQRVMVISYTMVEIPISLGGEKKHPPLSGCPTLSPCWSHLYQAYAGELDKIKHLGTIVSGINM